MQLRGRICRDEAGFTLLEVMVAAIILTVALLSLVSVINWGLRLSEEAQSRTVAMGLATAQMERVKAQYPKSTGDFTTNPILEGMVQGQTTTQTVETNITKTFTCTVSYSNLASYTTNAQTYTFNDMLVTVKVSWDDYTAGVTRQVALTSELVGR